MLSLRTMIRPDRKPLSMTVAFRFPGSAFVGGSRRKGWKSSGVKRKTPR